MLLNCTKPEATNLLSVSTLASVPDEQFIVFAHMTLAKLLKRSQSQSQVFRLEHLLHIGKTPP